MRILLFIGCLIACTTNGFSQEKFSNREEIRKMSINELIHNLQADDIRFNALHSMSELSQRDEKLVIPALETALDSADWQQRQFAAGMLTANLPFHYIGYIDVFGNKREEGFRSTKEFPTIYNSPDRLLQVLVEGLRSDHLPRSPSSLNPRIKGTQSHYENLVRGVLVFLANPTLATDHLQAGLDSDDTQQRFHCALILTLTDRHERFDRLLEIFIDNMKDDQVTGNACKAMYLAYQLGDKAVPVLETYLDAPDRQQRDAVRVVLETYRNPPKSLDDVGQPLEGTRIRFAWRHPVLQLNLGYLAWEWW